MRLEDVKKKLKDGGLKWTSFKSWIRGQTVGIYPDGSLDYYDWDVQRYIEGEKYVEKQTKKY